MDSFTAHKRKLQLSLERPSFRNIFVILELFQFLKCRLGEVLRNSEELAAQLLLRKGGAEGGLLLALQNVDPGLGAPQLDDNGLTPLPLRLELAQVC